MMLKYSIEIDVYSSQTTVNKILNELFYPFRAQPYDEFCQSLYENPHPKPVLFVSKAIKSIINGSTILIWVPNNCMRTIRFSVYNWFLSLVIFMKSTVNEKLIS